MVDIANDAEAEYVIVVVEDLEELGTGGGGEAIDDDDLTYVFSYGLNVDRMLQLGFSARNEEHSKSGKNEAEKMVGLI